MWVIYFVSANNGESREGEQEGSRQFWFKEEENGELLVLEICFMGDL